MDNLIIPVLMGAGVIAFIVGALKMFAVLIEKIKTVGGLEGLKATPLQMTEEHPAAIVPVVNPVGQVATTRLTWLFFALVALLSFGLGGYFQYRNIRAARLLENEGFATQALVAEKTISEDDDGDETYYVTYAFDGQSPDAGIQQVEREESVPYEFFTQVEEGERIDIIYARSDPKVARIMANYTPGDISYLPISVGVMLGVVDALLAVGLYRRLQNAMRLDAEGIMVTTTVLDLYVISGEDDSTHYVAYTLPDGQKVRHGIKPAIYKQLHVGDSIQLVYLPDNPKIFRLEWARPDWT